jgi:DNA-binding transcriptional LysR family regulator
METFEYPIAVDVFAHVGERKPISSADMDDPLLDLRVADLLTFLSVHRAKSVTGAARLLGVTPSQVSKAIARLEGALAVSLLVRGSRGVTVSEIGLSYVPRIEEIVERLRGLRGETLTGLPELTVAAPSFLHAFFLPRLTSALSDYRLRCISMPQVVTRAFATERLFDVAITIGKERFPESWVQTELGVMRRGLFASPRLAKRLGKQPVSEEKLAEIPFISPVYVINGHATPVDDGCPMPRERRKLGQEVEMLGLALDLAGRVDELVFGPLVAAYEHLKSGQLVEIDVAGWSPEPSPLWLCCNGDRVRSKTQRTLVVECSAALSRS